MWRGLLLKSTACLLQVGAPKFLHQRHFSSLLAQRVLNRTSETLWRQSLGRTSFSLSHKVSRNYKKDTKSTIEFPSSPITVTDIKQFLRSKDVPFHDGYSCLHVPSVFIDPSTRKSSFSLFIDKTTGQFLCKDTLVEGSWEDLQDCLEVIQKDEQDFLSPRVLLGYPESVEEQEERERELREVQEIWSSSVPFTDLPEDVAQLIKTMFQVFKLSCVFVLFGCLVFDCLLFPFLDDKNLKCNP